MTKWLAAATVAVIALLVFLWIQIKSPADAAPAPAPKRDIAAAQVSPLAQPHPLAVAAREAAEEMAKPKKIDPASDAFFYRFDEAVPPALSREAAKCYEGGIRRVHRNQKVKLGYKIIVKDGKVSFTDVKVVESTINDKALIACYVAEVSKVTWTDEELPDWQQDDELVLRPERQKKFNKDNLAYEGEGPIGKLESAGDVAASKELPRGDLAREQSPE